MGDGVSVGKRVVTADGVPARVAVKTTVGTSVGRAVAVLGRVAEGGIAVAEAGGRVTTITTVSGGRVLDGVAVGFNARLAGKNRTIS